MITASVMKGLSTLILLYLSCIEIPWFYILVILAPDFYASVLMIVSLGYFFLQEF